MSTESTPLVAPTIWSHSRMNVFEECPTKYRYEYILKERADRKESTPTVMGSRLHECIEDFYTDETVAHPKDRLVPRWEAFLKKLSSEHLVPEMLDITEGYNKILWRASAECTDPAIWIRNKDKSVPKSLDKNAAYIAAMEALGMAPRMARIDAEFRHIAGDQYSPVSITKAFADSLSIIPKWSDPPIIARVTDIEFPISHRVYKNGQFSHVVNGVRLPNGELFNGYIDLVGEVIPEMGGGVILADWKSSKGDAPSPLMVRAHQQLNKYTWAYADVQHQLTGIRKWPTHTAIGWLRDGSFVVSAVDPEYVEYTLKRQDSVIESIHETEKSGNFIKRDPLGYNSPCLTLSKDGSTASRVCGHLEKCWPKLFSELPKDIEVVAPPIGHAPPAGASISPATPAGPLNAGFGGLF